jgi:hypothetical protein
MSPSRRWPTWLGQHGAQTGFKSWSKAQHLPPVTFPEIHDVMVAPPNHSVVPGQFCRILRERKAKWALFLCPCGCLDVITLSLQRVHRPRWVVTRSDDGRPSMSPSVWRDVGCLSHFWVDDGRVYWCHDTGSTPVEHHSL